MINVRKPFSKALDGCRLLLLHRSCEMRDALIEDLEERGCEVLQAEDGAHAAEMLGQNGVDAVVVDYHAPVDEFAPAREAETIDRLTDVDPFVPLVLICERDDAPGPTTVLGSDFIVRSPATAVEIAEAVETVVSETLRERAQRKSGYIYAFRE